MLVPRLPRITAINSQTHRQPHRGCSRAVGCVLLSSEDEALLVRRDAFFVLDLCLDVLNGVAHLDVEGDGLPREGLDEDLHAATEAQHEVERGLLLDIVVGKRAPVLQPRNAGGRFLGALDKRIRRNVWTELERE